MIDRPEGGERTVLVHIFFPAGNVQEDITEFQELARSAGALFSEVITGRRDAPDPKYFVGSGKAQEIFEAVKIQEAELVIFNHALTPAQERNLEQLFKCRVVDRTGLILDIFAQRARSFEGQLQVELAFLKHLSTRLVRGWTHLERQRGGIGLRGGPGEKQLELDRRLIKKRIEYISDNLSKVKKQRDQGRKSRRKAAVPTIALVGYTNAGKSTLFNRLTGAEVYVANRLFATLDPTLRRLELAEVGSVVVADTVGFIRHLPHDLVQAFQATLEEVIQADLLLHVVDAHDTNRENNILQVNHVLTTIGADTVPQVLVFNKIDLCEHLEPNVLRDEENKIRKVYISTLKNTGIDLLHQAMTENLGKDIIQHDLILEPAESKVRAELYQLKAIQSEKIDDHGRYHLVVRMPKVEWLKINKKINF